MSVTKEVPSMEAPCSSAEQFLGTDWAGLHSVNSAGGFSSYHVGNANVPTIERLASLPCFGSGNLSEIMGSFGFPESTQMAGSLCAQEFPATIERGAEKNVKGKKRKKLPECGSRPSNSSLVSSENVEAEKQKSVPSETAKSLVAKDDKQKNVSSPSSKESGDAAKDDYIHVRARRGQATNSHSLAERVRREKISERMRLLQDLVPGCNKITGKAVMLDEIINYVQSLQRQVEFLSMKLAAVNPELNLDIDQIFTKENLHSRYGSLPSLGHCLQMGISHSQLQPGMIMPSNLMRTATNHHISPMAQMPNSWDNEFQNAIQMGLLPDVHHEGIELNGSMKVEL